MQEFGTDSLFYSVSFRPLDQSTIMPSCHVFRCARPRYLYSAEIDLRAIMTRNRTSAELIKVIAYIRRRHGQTGEKRPPRGGEKYLEYRIRDSDWMNLENCSSTWCIRALIFVFFEGGARAFGAKTTQNFFAISKDWVRGGNLLRLSKVLGDKDAPKMFERVKKSTPP